MADTQEYKVRIPVRNSRKSFHIMKFNSSLNVKCKEWSQVRMVRENNEKGYHNADEDLPKSGAGSEFGREQREEARRRKYGIHRRKYDPDAQPWLMRVGSKKEGKTYKGVREGGVAENTTFYVFTHAADGCFEAHPVKEWYNFTPRVTYKTFDAEEAEERFAARGKILNHWAVTIGKKLKPDQELDGEDPEEEGKKGKKGGKKGKDLKISDMDDWVDSDDGLDSGEDDEDGEKESKKKKGKKGKEEEEKGGKRSKDSKKKNRKKNKEDVELEGFEDSDDGDGEGREVDYMSDESSESEEEMMEQANQKGVDQDEGLAKMLDSEESESDEEKKDDENDSEEEDEDKPAKKSKKRKDDGDENESDPSSDEEETGKKKGKKGTGSGKSSKNSSRAGTPTPKDEKKVAADKRKALVDNLLDPNASAEPAAKRSRLDMSSGSSVSTAAPAAGSAEAAVEEDVRRYLARKPMTTTEVLKKLMQKKIACPKDDLMPLLVNVLKRINPHKQKVKGTMYLSLKDRT